MSDSVTIHRLRCEYLDNPRGIDEPCPRLSWAMASDRRGARQVAYEIQVASSPERLAAADADVWTSGRVASERSTQTEYAGPALTSRQQVWWRVVVEDELGGMHASKPASWSMGLLHAADWSASWIAADPEIVRRDPDARDSTATMPGSVPLFRREFAVVGDLRRATLYTTARGLVDLTLNGNRVTADEFVPEWTDYHQRFHYRTYDVTELLLPGGNALGVMLGDGWWSGFIGWQERRGQYVSLENSLLMQLEIETADGRRTTIVSDGQWRCEVGPILASDFMLGETYDARREQTGWDRPGFDDERWVPAVLVPPPRVQTPHFAPPHDESRGQLSPKIAAAVANNANGNGSLLANGDANALLSERARNVALVAQRSEPVRVVQRISPIAVSEPAPGVAIYDLGQNIAGIVELTVWAPRGTRVQLRHGERLNPDGTLYTENLRRAAATDVYILRGSSRDEPEVWRPRFTFHGFQYVEITVENPPPSQGGARGGSATPQDQDNGNDGGVDESLPLPLPARERGIAGVTGLVLMSATSPAGRFRCGDELVNRLAENIAWGQRGNFLSVPTDCPQRDERLGWMGDAQVFLRTATYNADVAAFFTKWMTDVSDSQDAEGVFPDVAPRISEGENFVGLDGLGGAAGWADAGIVVPWTMWRVYGDLRLAERHWDAMVAWLDWIERHNPDGVRSRSLGNNYGDWLCIPSDTTFRTQSPMKTLLATAYWADDAAKMAQLARALGKSADAERFEAMFARVRAAFQREWHVGDGRLAVETQTAYLLALAFDLLPQEDRPQAAAGLVENIESLGDRLSTGFIGVSHLNPQLTLAGRADVAYRLLLCREYPSWLYPVLHGATTIWERWNGWTAAEGFFNPQMNSFNHYSLGSVGEWLFRHVAGIELDSDSPGFQQFVIRPYVDAALGWCEAAYDSQFGEIRVRWEFEPDGALEVAATVPANTRAEIHLPCPAGATIEESGRPVAEAPGLAFCGRDEQWTRFNATAGSYAFRIRTHPE